MKVVFWGTPDFSLPALRALEDEGHEVLAVVTQPDRRSGRGRKTTPSPVKAYAEEGMIPVLQPEKASDPAFLDELRGYAPELSVVVAYGQILTREVLDLPTHGSVNIHASLLPALRGAAPVHWAIIQGYTETGVTIMRMDTELDAGPILYQVEEEIRPDESMSDLGRRLSEVGASALIETLGLMELGAIEETPQDHDSSTYAPKVGREMAQLDWTLPAIEVARWIRGLDAVPGAWSRLNDGDPVKLFRPRVEVHQGEPGEVLEIDPEVGILIGAGFDAVRVREVQPAGKRRMEAGEWINGRGIAVGDRLG